MLSFHGPLLCQSIRKASQIFQYPFPSILRRCVFASFYSNYKFRAKIKITYTTIGDDDVEIIYDKVVDFEDNVKEHIYYINDVILGSIDIEIYANIDYGNPVIGFEILQSNVCHMSKEHKLEIKFPD